MKGGKSMRIDAYNRISRLYEAQQTSKVKEKEKVDKTKEDGVEISKVGRDIQVVREGLKQAPDIRYDKVNDIIRRMESGTYSVSAEEVANKIVDNYFDESI